jgi:catechol 2,3-dioxygenase-like lactoylglutathione lyase family enzyme
VPDHVARGVDHLGITVPDVEAATEFFEAAFGAEVLYDLVVPDGNGVPTMQPLNAPGGSYDRVTAVGIKPDARVRRVRTLRLGNGPSLELFEFTGVEQHPAVTSSDFGLQHFAIYVDDLEAAAAAVERAGGILRTGPNAAPGWESDATSRFHYVQAPWGTSIELITYPDGQLHEKTGRARWRPDPVEGA